MRGRYDKIEEAKRAMRKKQELEKRFRPDGEGSSEDSDVDDEDKITEQEEAGAARILGQQDLMHAVHGGCAAAWRRSCPPNDHHAR